MHRPRASQQRQWGWIAKLRGLVLVAPVAAMLACGDSEGGKGKPDVQIQPVAPLNFVFHNATGSPVYVDWSANKAPLRVLRDDVDLLLGPGCSPLCKDNCACLACPAPELKVLRIGPGDKLQVTWEALHFLLHTCAEAASCSCAEPWPVTAGKYLVRLDGSTRVKGGTPNPSDPDMMDGAEIDPQAPACVASVVFDLVGAAELTIPIECK
jgi:hypothetical protein